MRRMSFSLTTEQVRARTKTVTRRKGWTFLRPGDHVLAVEKAMGLKGEKHKVLDEIVIVNVRREPLAFIADDGELKREGFPDMTPNQFVEMYIRANGGDVSQQCTRIEFLYAEEHERLWDGWGRL